MEECPRHRASPFVTPNGCDKIFQRKPADQGIPRILPADQGIPGIRSPPFALSTTSGRRYGTGKRAREGSAGNGRFMEMGCGWLPAPHLTPSPRPHTAVPLDLSPTAPAAVTHHSFHTISLALAKHTHITSRLRVSFHRSNLTAGWWPWQDWPKP
jgi:hypothetical protein